MHVAPRWIPWLLAACLASAAHALPAVQARFTLGFAFPPNPCLATSFLDGAAWLRVGDPAAGGSVTSAALTARLAMNATRVQQLEQQVSAASLGGEQQAQWNSLQAALATALPA